MKTALAFIPCLLAACSPARPELVPQIEQAEQAIQRGEPTHDYSSVVALVDDEGTAFCTGVSISSREVLSAAHCLLPQAPRLAAIRSEAALDAGSGLTLAVEDAWHDPDFDERTLEHDLALITLSGALPGPHLELLREPLLPEEVGSFVQIVGYGATETGEAGLKHVGMGRIASLDGGALQLDPAPGTPCGGDSGAPVLLERPDGMYVAGIISRGDLFCALYAVASPVDERNATFLHAPAPGEPRCAAALPGAGGSASRSVLVLSAACAALYARTRRRRAPTTD